MHNEIRDLPKITVDLDLRKSIVIFATVGIFLVAPILGITYYQNMPKLSSEEKALKAKEEAIAKGEDLGRVAGASDSREDPLGLGSITKIDLNDNATRFNLLAGFFGTISLITLLYLLIDHKNYKREIIKS